MLPRRQKNLPAFGEYPFDNTIVKTLKIDHQNNPAANQHRTKIGHRILRRPCSDAIDNCISSDKAAGYQSQNNAFAVDRRFTKLRKSSGQNGD